MSSSILDWMTKWSISQDAKEFTVKVNDDKRGNKIFCRQYKTEEWDGNIQNIKIIDIYARTARNDLQIGWFFGIFQTWL